MSDPFLVELQRQENEFIVRAFLSLCQVAHWRKTGAILGNQLLHPVVSSTVKDATSNLALAFRSDFLKSPFHIEAPFQSLPTVRTLLRALNNANPLPAQQKAITPKLLRKLLQLLGGGAKADGGPPAHTQQAWCRERASLQRGLGSEQRHCTLASPNKSAWGASFFAPSLAASCFKRP